MPNRIRYLTMANAMLTANFTAILTSLMVVNIFYLHSSLVPSEMIDLMWQVGRYTDTVYFVIIILLTVIYEQPIRKALRIIKTGGTVDETLMTVARRRLLNEPYYLIALDLFLWVIIVFLVMTLSLKAGTDPHLVYVQAFKGGLDALVTITAAYFFLQMVLQRFLVPDFFPEGGLSEAPGVRRIRIRGRLFVLAFAINVVPLTNIVILHYSSLYVPGPDADPAVILSDLNRVIIIESFVFMAAALVLTFVVSGNLRRPFYEIIHVLRRITRGRFDERVRVISNDEIGYAGDAINRMTEGLKEREMIKDAFGRFVAREVRDEVLSGRVPLDGEFKYVSVLFADIRDFTPLTEKSDPKMIVRIMNAYFKEMAAAVHKHGGLVLQFVGDEIYAVFGAPIRREDHPVCAFRAGLEMNRRLKTLNESFKAEGYPQIRHGIGIHSGRVIAANIGSPERQSYLLVGDTVNLASRLQTMTKKIDTEMLISAQTHDAIQRTEIKCVRFRDPEKIPIKGKTDRVKVYALRR